MNRRARAHPHTGGGGGGLGLSGEALRQGLSTGRRRRGAHAVRSPRTRMGFRHALRTVAMPGVPERGRHRSPRHAAPPQPGMSPVVACLVALVLTAGGAALGSVRTGGALAATVAHTDSGGGQSVSIMNGMAKAFAGSDSAVSLPAATAPPAPAPPSLAGAPALRAHEIFGFAPYWTLPISSGFDLARLTTLAYFSVDVSGDATVQQSGPGWVGYQSQALANLVTSAHGAGDRVVLTASCFDQSALDKMAADPTAGTRLATTLVQLVTAKNLDGVNIDFEGKGPKDQAGLDALVAAVSSAMHHADPHWQVTMDTYASSAGDPTGFYDIRGLNASVDAFFVMAYDMNAPATPSPTAPLTGPGFTDLVGVKQYTSVVAASKVILGVPYYGYDWPTAGPGLGDPATGPASPLSYSQVVATGGRVYWDPATQTPWTSYLVGSQWHQTWFDNPTSLALKAQLADSYHIAGLGIWALGMEGATPTMLTALQGNAPIVKNLVAGPPASAVTTTTTSAPTNYVYAATWNGVAVTLTPVNPAVVVAAAQTPAPGQLTGFTTNDPARLCLESDAALTVTALGGTPVVYAVSATPSTACAPGTWEFTVPAAPAAGTPSATTTTTSPTTPVGPTSTTSTSTTSTTSTTAP